MGKPVERQNLSLPFFVLSSLIAICTGWSFYEEFVGRRPWKDYQSKISSLDQQRLEHDLRFYERKLDSGDIKVADPENPEQTMPLAEARAKLDELAKGLSRDQAELEKLTQARADAKIEADDADLKVKMLRSEDDGLFYEFQHAQHSEMVGFETAAKLKAQGKEQDASAALKEAEGHQHHREEVEKQRAKKHEEIAQAEKDAIAAAQKLEAAEAALEAKRGQHDKLKAAIEAAVEQVTTAKTAVQAAAKKGTELTQYWLTSYDNSVDRCQNCHAAVDRCGFSRPFEVLSALNAPNAKPDEVSTSYCVNPDTIEAFKSTADAVCGLEWDVEASAKGSIEADKGICIAGDAERHRVAEFLRNHCGPTNPGVALLNDSHKKAGCLGANAWAVLANYVQDPTQRQTGDQKWSACDLRLSESGDTCLEGAAKDQVLIWLSGKCPDTSSTVTGLKEHKKACGAGEDGKRLAQVKPVLYDLPVWAQAHPYRMQLLGSAHPSDRFGCTSCHEGQGAQTKGVAGAPFQHGWDDHYWERPMLDLIAHKKFRPATWGPPPGNESVPGEWVTHQSHFREATCAKCHKEEVNLSFAPTFSRGRKLVAEIGCHGCHPVDAFANFPKLGPTLTDLKRKTTPAFLAKWIAYPKSFRPRTKMPNFWPEALDVKYQERTGSPEHNLRTEEVGKIAAFLWKSSSTEQLPAVPVKGDAERGRGLAYSVGCRGCHTFVPPEKLCTPEQVASGKSRGTPQEPAECESARPLSGSEARDFAPNLSNIGLKTNERWLFAWLKDPTSMWPQTRMPNLRLTDQQAADITAFLMTLKEGSLAEPPAYFSDESSEAFTQAAAEGDRLVTKYGCSGCHDIKGHENDAKIGADLNEYGRKTTDLLDFGNAIPNPRHQSWFNFVDLKLRAPRAYRYERVETKMPQFDLNDDEVEAVMTFLKSRTPDKVPSTYNVAAIERRAAIAHMDQTVEYYNCKGCHVLEGEGGRIRDSYPEDDLWKAPPILQAQGWRVQPDWFFGFLRDPQPQLRPWLDIRMPTFPLSDNAATSIVRGLSAYSNVPYPYITVDVKKPEGKDLEEVKAMVAELRCFACHTSGEPAPGQDRSSLAPNLLLARQRLRPDWVYNWVKNPQSLQEGTRMPTFFSPDDMNTVMYAKYFGGSQEKQLQMLRDYVMTLGDTTPTAAAPAAGKKARGGGAGSR